MKETKKRGCLSAIGSVFQGIDLARRLVMNLLFLIALALLLALFQDPITLVPDKAALVVAPQGAIVEQLSGDAVARAFAEVQGAEEPQTLMQDLLDAIELARDDERIQALVLDLSSMSGGGFSKVREIHTALQDFKSSGKKVIAMADFYTRSSYFLATAADEIYLHEEGLALIEGFGVFRTYYKDAIDYLGIDWNVFRVGEYKSAVEPYTRSDMSPETQQSTLDWLNDLWSIWLEEVARARNLPTDVLEDSLANYDVYVQKAEGDQAQTMVQLGLVDALGGRYEVRQRMIELVGAHGNDPETFSQINFWDYLLSRSADRRLVDRGGDAVAVIPASGPILMGDQLPGSIGGDSTAKLIRQARLDDSIKSVVLRLDSGGGSQFASEEIRRELVRLTEAGKPLIASMSSVAASGAYWIATEADEIWASETTLTGSIGIYAMIPTFQKSLEKIGLDVDGVGTNWMSSALRVDRELHPRLANVIRSSIERDYERFLKLVADSREMSVEEVDGLARGRVWSGVDAKELGLVDHLGNFHDALAAAAEKAELDEGYSVRYLEPELDFADQLVLEFLTRSARFIEPVARNLKPSSIFDQGLARFLAEQAEILARFDDPRGIYAHCQCEVNW